MKKHSWAVRFIRLLIRFYQRFLNPILKVIGGPTAGCRFHPTCSRYFLEACEKHGAITGSYLGIRRILRCHPWGGSGEDPVPPKSPSFPFSTKKDNNNQHKHK